MKDPNSFSAQKCDWCDSTNLEADLTMVRCLDCGMGKYKNGRQKRA